MIRGRALLANLTTAGIAILTILAILEVCLRVFPVILPSGFYGSSRYREDLLTNVHGSRVIYNKVRRVVRSPNREGFLDVEWQREKPPGSVRVGFFGDSYVEAAQVPLDSTFYRRVAHSLESRRIETLGVGISGWGTLHSANAASVLAPRYDLDVVIYVFVENDLGDNAYVIQAARRGRLTPKAYALASPDPPGYDIRWVNPPGDQSLAYRIGKALQNRLLMVQLFWSRFQLLLTRGVELHGGEEARAMTEVADAVPNQNDLPSSWPDKYRDIARELGARILRHWRDETAKEGRQFLILYVPRGELQLSGELPIENTWLPWLRETAAMLGIPLIDPSPELATRSRSGTAMYDDHWSPAGHEAVAEVLERHLAPRYGH